MMKIALVGNPNSGKTTVFNGLTGSNQSVGNWPGVTVEKKSGKLNAASFQAEVTDLPGLYSLSTISLEEEIAAKYILRGDSDWIVNVVDASNLERNLFLTHQLLETGFPILVALNCMDLVAKRLDELDVSALERALGVPVIPITASKKHGISDVIDYLSTHAPTPPLFEVHYDEFAEKALTMLSSILPTRLDAIRYMEDGEKGIREILLSEEDLSKLQELSHKIANVNHVDFDMILPKARYDRILSICNEVLVKHDVYGVSQSDRIDRILTHKWLGIPLFGGIMFLVFYLAFGPIGQWITNGFVTLMDLFLGWIRQGIESLGMQPWVTSLVTNGVFGGLSAVVGFLPQLMILFFFLALLEDSGYMARAAFLMDRALKRFGLSGKAFIPMLIGFGCSVPAISSTRTLDKVEDRKLTTMIIPFISCGAKAPIYGVFAGALFASSSYLVVFSMYLMGILVAVLSAILFKKTILRGANANYMMELPEYRMPSAKNMWLHTWERSKGFLIKAGTVLLGAFIIIWFLSYFGIVDGSFRLLSDTEISNSLLGIIGRAIQPIFRPMGIQDWQATVAMMSGFVAKESVVGTLGILYGVSGDVLENGSLLYSHIQAHFTPLQAYAYMTFALLATPCIAAVAAMKRELGSWKWLAFGIVYEMVVAYLVATAIYQIGSLGLGNALSYLLALVVIIFVYSMVRKVIRQKGKTCSHCTGCSLSSSCTLPQKEVYLNKEGAKLDEPTSK